MFFDKYDPQRCCLCGHASKLTGEHKIKASALREEFGAGPLVVVNNDGPVARQIPAQSSNSKALKFKASVCAECNSTSTQASDRAFDRFHRSVQICIEKNEDPSILFSNNIYNKRSKEYLNIFRYFAKLLCCHLAFSEGPRPKRMSGFAIGLANKNCVWLNIQRDWTYSELERENGPLNFAAHGGLVVYVNKRDGSPTAFHSTLTIGAVQYVFFSRLNLFERCSLRTSYAGFYEKMREIGQDSIANPISVADQMRLGLISEQKNAS